MLRAKSRVESSRPRPRARSDTRAPTLPSFNTHPPPPYVQRSPSSTNTAASKRRSPHAAMSRLTAMLAATITRDFVKPHSTAPRSARLAPAADRARRARDAGVQVPAQDQGRRIPRNQLGGEDAAADQIGGGGQGRWWLTMNAAAAIEVRAKPAPSGSRTSAGLRRSLSDANPFGPLVRREDVGLPIAVDLVWRHESKPQPTAREGGREPRVLLRLGHSACRRVLTPTLTSMHTPSKSLLARRHQQQLHKERAHGTATTRQDGGYLWRRRRNRGCRRASICL